MLDAFQYWPASWDREIGQSIAFSILGMVFNNIVGLPLSIYNTFVIEERHGFNKQTFRFFVKDFIKKNLVSLVIMTPIIGLVVKIVQVSRVMVISVVLNYMRHVFEPRISRLNGVLFL